MVISKPTVDTMLWLDRHDVASSAAAFSGELTAQWLLPVWATHAASETSAHLVGGLLRWNDTHPDGHRALVGQLGLRWASWRLLVVEVWDGGRPRRSAGAARKLAPLGHCSGSSR